MAEAKQKTFREKLLSFGAKLLLALLILSFGVWGIGDYVSPQHSGSTAVATIGESEISGYEFGDEVRRQVQRLQSIFGGNFTAEQAQAMGITENVLESLIQRNLFTEGARAMGLTVSNDLVANEIRNDARFKSPGGDFSRLQFEQTIQQAGLSENGYANLFKGELLRSQFLSGIESSQTVPATLSNSIYQYRKEKRIADFIEIKHDTFNNIPTANDESLKKYHQDNAARFTAPEYRAITLVQMQIKDIVDEIEVTEEQIQESYNDRINEFKTPETRKLQQILVSDEAMAKSIYEKISAGGDFTEVAKDVAKLDAATLELGTLTKGQVPLPELADAAFNLIANTASQPVKSPLGWHILRATEIKAATQKTLAEVRANIKLDIASDKAVDSLYNLSNKFEDELGGGSTIDEAAGRLNFKVRKIPALSSAGTDMTGKALTDLTPAIIQTAFTTEKDQDSPLTDFGDNGYFILHVDDIVAPALKPFETVRTDVELALKSEQQAEAAETKVKALIERMKGSTNLADIAEELGAKVVTTKEFIRTGEGLEVRLPGDLVTGLFKTSGKTPVTAIANDRHFIAVVKEIKSADPVADKEGLDQIANQLRGNITNDLSTQFANALRTKLGVTINRAAINSVQQ